MLASNIPFDCELFSSHFQQVYISLLTIYILLKRLNPDPKCGREVILVCCLCIRFRDFNIFKGVIVSSFKSYIVLKTPYSNKYPPARAFVRNPLRNKIHAYIEYILKHKENRMKILFFNNLFIIGFTVTFLNEVITNQ